ncbi:oligopeptidase F. Metallo peptidase. MEROPS family M03B [Alteribacillus persepolensis]|uniref:Oligopeptidase F n=1 Tax=Alteribacillus persepolensis TaxID=568899 RepID=A0A1G8EPR3_9BACI|nr:oligoendopeptidase F [Alteribacillus persepolensis]SDH71864.1 oligopeptidase F. Metallo peptidase. MEROPS family M03B [Alteribacillus persepolensis]
MSEKETKQVPKRDEISKEYTWNLEDIFATDEKWEQEFKQIQELVPELTAYKGTLADSADTLYQALKKQDEIGERFGRLFSYAHMRYDQDTSNSFYQGLEDRASGLAAKLGQAMAFLVPEILSIPEDKLEQFLNEHEDLKQYRHALREINEQRPHVLNESEESILAQVSEVTSNPSNTFGMLNNADLAFPSIKDEEGNEVQVTHGRILRFFESDDRRVRKDAFEAVYGTYQQYRNTLASTLNGQVKKNLFNANVRKYDSARQAALSKNHIPEVVYDQLVETVNKNLHLLHRYVRLRKRVLGLDEIHNYDLYTPLVKDVDMKVTYEEAQQYVLKAVEPLGEEYKQTVQEGYNNRWIDVYENKGKRSGAYSSGAYGTMPYILMNWQDNVNNMFTLAHELGHSMHSYLSRKHQPYHYSDYTIFVAEVASTVNEALLNDYLLQTTEDKKKKMYLLNHFLEGFRGTVFRQTMFAEFEQLIHEKAAAGEALTPDLLEKEYYALNEKYFGEDITLDEGIALEWSRIPHFYMNFYVYQYATGYSAAAALSRQILEEGEPAVNRYLGFLKSGSSDYPIEMLKKAGVDMTSKEPVQEAMALFEQTLEEMEQLLEQ